MKMYEVRNRCTQERERGRTIMAALRRLFGVRDIFCCGDGKHTSGCTVTVARHGGKRAGRVLGEAVVYHNI